MIPKIVHYCWFGGKEKPKKIQRCIESWKEHLSDYQFVEWNENNFDVRSSEYVAQAYDQKKYAFVSDIARIEALSRYGGIYMDTDVKVYKSFDDLLGGEAKCILGFEYENWVATSFIACEKGHPILQEFEKIYEKEKFIGNDGAVNSTTNVFRLTQLLCSKGLCRENRKQKLQDGIVVFPIEYFSPYNYADCIMEKTDNSYCAHLFFVTWMSGTAQFKKTVKKILVRIIGKKGIHILRGMLKKIK